MSSWSVASRNRHTCSSSSKTSSRSTSSKPSGLHTRKWRSCNCRNETNCGNSWSAVVRGAVIKGLEGGSAAITKRKCRRFYGTSCSQIFRPGVHDESDSYIDEYDGRKRAMGQMEWLLKKGQDLDTSEASHAELDLAAHFWPHETTRIAVSRLLVYNGDEAPASSDSNVSDSSKARKSLY